jgi:hypothetical protein
MQQSITDRSLAHLKPQTKRYEVRDKLLPGFGVRISPKNQKSFFVVTRIGTLRRAVKAMGIEKIGRTWKLPEESRAEK